MLRAVYPEVTNPVHEKLRSSIGDRRHHTRYCHKMGVALYQQGVAVPVRCTLTDISRGGCYVEIPSPFPLLALVEVLIHTEAVKLWVSGVVKVVHTCFGMGIEFKDLTLSQQTTLDRLIDSLSSDSTGNCIVPGETREEKRDSAALASNSPDPATNLIAELDPLLSLFNQKGSLTREEFLHELRKIRGTAP